MAAYTWLWPDFGGYGDGEGLFCNEERHDSRHCLRELGHALVQVPETSHAMGVTTPLNKKLALVGHNLLLFMKMKQTYLATDPI